MRETEFSSYIDVITPQGLSRESDKIMRVPTVSRITTDNAESQVLECYVCRVMSGSNPLGLVPGRVVNRHRSQGIHQSEHAFLYPEETIQISHELPVLSCVAPESSLGSAY